MLNSTTSATSDSIQQSNVYASEGATDAVETFDDLEGEQPVNESEVAPQDGDDWSEPAEEDKEVIKKKENKDEVSDELKLLSDSDQTEEVGKKKEKKEEEAEEESEEDEKVEAKEESEDSEEKELPKESKGKIKVRIDGELYGLDGSSAVRTKVDGEYRDVPLSELQRSYSSQATRDKAYAEVRKQQDELKAERQKIDAAKQKARDLFDPVINILQDETKDPYEALQFLVDKIGGDPQKLYKRTIESRIDEVDKLMNMSEVERQNYFLSKENEFLRQRTEARVNAEKERVETEKFYSSIDKLRDQYGVSEEQFVKGMDQLEKIYGEEFAKLDHPFIVQYAAQLPHIEAVQELVRPYVDEIGESKIPELVQQLSSGLWRKEFSSEQIKGHLKARYGVSSNLKELNRKVLKNQGKEPKVVTTKEDDRIESFDDLLD